MLRPMRSLPIADFRKCCEVDTERWPTALVKQYLHRWPFRAFAALQRDTVWAYCESASTGIIRIPIKSLFTECGHNLVLDKIAKIHRIFREALLPTIEASELICGHFRSVPICPN